MWFASFCVRIERQKKKSAPGAAPRTTGVDRNVARPAVLSDGTILGARTGTRQIHERLAHLQRNVSRKMEALRRRHGIAPGGSLKGVEKSTALRKAQTLLARFLAKMARCRKDQAHKMSRYLVDNYDIISFEALKTKEMTSTDRKDRSSSHCRDILDRIHTPNSLLQ